MRYGEVYPGVDLVFYGNQRELEYDFVLQPGADPRTIRLSFEGVEGLSRDAAGELVLRTNAGLLRQRRPVVYQEVDGARREVAGEYVIAADRSVGFKLGEYDRTRPLVIDPVLVYSTFLGSGNNDTGYGIAVDSAGNAYVTGNTASDNFPTANPLQPARKGVGDIFITKLNPAGTALVYSTYLGGANADSAAGIAVDDAGSAYVAGSTMSFDFPVTPGAYQTVKGGGVVNGDAFVVKLNRAGNALVFSTYLGGPDNDDRATGIRVDVSRNVYVSGTTSLYGSGFFPVTPGAFQTTYGGGTTDAFASKLNSTGSSLVYSTYLGGSDKDYGNGIAIDFDGNAYVVGETYSNNFPTTPGSFRATKTDQPSDAFATKLNQTASALVYSTFLGGSVTDGASDVAVDSRRNAYITGNTSSPNFPVTSGVFQPNIGKLCDGCATNDAFVTRLNAAGTALVFSTFLGGAAGNEVASGIAVDAAGNAYVAGGTNASDFPVLGAVQFEKKYGYDAFVTELDASGRRLIYSTFLGGRGSSDSATSVAVDGGGNTYVTGGTNSRDFPITPGAFQTLINRNNLVSTFDAFVTKLQAAAPLPADGRILGRIVTDQGEPLGGATVTLTGWQTATTTTDAGGNYAFTNLQTGAKYLVQAAKKSYRMNPSWQSIDGLTGTA
ncbi:MAG TPA: SBBP repeat-containing protein, partial [Pyrinomonadaceae bacterium]|nr:SBBP repeat-containing protein [Pyrinomonadaceae bacterium]